MGFSLAVVEVSIHLSYFGDFEIRPQEPVEADSHELAVAAFEIRPF